MLEEERKRRRFRRVKQRMNLSNGKKPYSPPEQHQDLESAVNPTQDADIGRGSRSSEKDRDRKEKEGHRRKDRVEGFDVGLENMHLAFTSVRVGGRSRS